jgi:hypothetical protein
VISQDITIRGKSSGPPVAVPPPAPSKPVVDEVLDSLSLGRGVRGPGPERVSVSADDARLSAPFPEPPFLALSSRNIRALYDSWTFEVVDGRGTVVRRREGVGRVREPFLWDGQDDDGVLALVCGRPYRYRFTGRRGGRSFIVESRPVRVRSFSLTGYDGETRLEAETDLVFRDGSATFAPGAGPYLDAVVSLFKARGAREDGSYRLELLSDAPRGRLAAARAKALRARIAAALPEDAVHVRVERARASRGPAVAALAPAARGAVIRMR